MKAARLLLSAFLFAGCGAQNSAADDQPQWLVGSWLPVGEDNPFPLACESDARVIYEANGEFHREGGSGTWSVKEGQLTERLTTVHDPEPETRIEGQPLVSTVERIDSDLFRSSYSNGEAVVYRRCPG